MAKKETTTEASTAEASTAEAPTAAAATEKDTAPVNLGVLAEQPTVTRKPVKSKLDDGTLRTDY